MSDNEFYKIDKLLPFKTKAQGRPYVKDGDLQIHLPNIKGTGQLENANAFNKLLSYYHEIGKTSSTGGRNFIEQDAVRVAMEEAENTFNSMMEISKQLRQACQEIMQMQT
jgi:hypothetical protein